MSDDLHTVRPHINAVRPNINAVRPNINAVRLATFNLESLDDAPRGRACLESRIQALRPQLQRLHADILCLQEVNGQLDATKKRRTLHALDRVLEGTVYATFHRVSTQSPSGHGVRDRHNLVIVSRFPILATHEVCNQLVEAPLYRCQTQDPPQDKPQPVVWDRPMLYVDVDLGEGQKMGVINVHLRAPRAAFVTGQKQDRHTWKTLSGWAEGLFLATLKAAGQALEVRMFLERQFDLDEDVLVCVAGDFNADDRQAPVRIIAGDEDDTGQGTLSSRILIAAERALPQSQRFSTIHRGCPHMVDHILLSQRLMGWLRHVECHNEALHDEVASPAAVQGAPDSYHAPLVCELVPPDSPSLATA